MPRLQAVLVHVCDLAAPQFHLYCLPWRVSQAGKLLVLVVQLSCVRLRIGDFGRFFTVSGRTTACKRGITFVLLRPLCKPVFTNTSVSLAGMP